MEWTFRPLDYFFGLFFGPFFRIIFWTFSFTQYFFGPFYRGGGKGGNTPLVLREWWDAVNQYSGRGDRQTVITSEGVEDELLIRREGWEVVIEVNATD